MVPPFGVVFIIANNSSTAQNQLAYPLTRPDG